MSDQPDDRAERLVDANRLRARTLARQFPAGEPPAGGWTEADLLDLVARVGPVQSQVPRSPFLVAASRLPGIERAVVEAAFGRHRLVKTSSLRGTVHTTVAAQHPWVDAVARSTRAAQLRQLLRLSADDVEALVASLEAFAADDWRERADLVTHARGWLGRRRPELVAALDREIVLSAVWGHSGLVRAPRDGRWDRRTDTLHRTAAALDPALAPADLAAAVRALVLVHLGAYGPATETDVAWWLGLRLTPVRRAVAELGGRIVRLAGPDGRRMLDRAELAAADDDAERAGREVDPGLRLLPEFDGLTLGYHADGRDRFVDPDDLARVWSKVNGVWQPVVLHRGRLVAGWKVVAAGGGRSRIELTPFRAGLRLPADELGLRVDQTAAVLGLTVSDVAVLPPPDR